MKVDLTANEIKHIVRALEDKQAHLLNILPKHDDSDMTSMRKRVEMLESIISKLTEEFVKS